MYMLEFSKAFIPSIATLRGAPGNHGDPTEGRWSPVDEFMRDGSAELLDLLVNGILPSARSKGSSKEPRPSPPTERTVLTAFGPRTIPLGSDHLRTLNNRECAWMDAWCWHKFEHEHMAMWRQYGAGDGAVCVKSSIGKLVDAISMESGHQGYIGAMVYTDRFSGTESKHEEFSLYLQKSRAYVYEGEIRALMYDPAADIDATRDMPGRIVPLDLEKMISNVIVHPDSPPWMFDLITVVLEKKLGRGASRSSIYLERLNEP
jgi:hypothetical protein